ncbi:hypothetical protein ACIGCM_03580 [Pseudomonas sp. NPDC078700]|uniref:hypothetical protein n=1 Tax=Pseudomonas sp. NPDC078700 TaxID=3364424 RepID=UPI0037C74E95
MSDQGEAWAVSVEPAPAPILIEHINEYAVTLGPDSEPVVVTVGEQGPPGKAGQPGPAGGSALQRQAGETLSALLVVYEQDDQVFRLDYRDGENIDQMLGITLSAADIGADLNVQRSGPLDDAGWNWALGRVWLGANGSLTQTPALDGYDVLIGSAVSATRIILNLQDPIELE